MSPRRNLSAWVALCLLATLPLAVRAAEPDASKDAPKPSLDVIVKDLGRIGTDMELLRQTNLEARKDLDVLKKRLGKLEKNIESLVRTMEAYQKEQVRISSYFAPGQGGPATEEPVGLTLEARVRQLESRLKSLEDRVNAARPAPSLIQGTGTIRLENRTALATTIFINGVGYRLQPFETRNLTGYQAGTFTYEVMVDGYGLTGNGTRVLQANQTYRLFTY